MDELSRHSRVGPWSERRLLRGAQLLQQRLCRLIKECRLSLVTDLNHRDVGKTSVQVRLDRLHDSIKIRTTRDLLGNVFRPDELARPLESRRRWEIRVHRPTTAEPPELIMGPLDGSLLVGVSADRQLADLACCRALFAIPGLDQLRLRLDSYQVISQRRELADRLLTRHRNRYRDPTFRGIP